MSPYFLACAIDGCQTPVTPRREYVPLGDFCDEHRAQILAAMAEDFPPESGDLASNIFNAIGRLLTRVRG